VVQEHVVIRAQAEYIVGTIRSVVRRAERANMRSLRVGAGQIFQAGSELLFSLGLPKYNAQL
jgi:hypothetical protein